MNILLICYYWPPSAGSGVQRWMYYANYLQELGHRITVLTADETTASYPGLDDSLRDTVKTIPVYKIKERNIIQWYSFLKTGKSKGVVPQGNVGSKKKTWFDKFSLFVRGNFFIPDARIGWVNEVKRFLKTHPNSNYDLVITSGPPHSVHLAGNYLKQKHQLKWIMDYRDPWIEVFYYDLFYKTNWIKRKEERLEKNWMDNADLILTVGENLKKILQQKTQTPVDFVYNGFDHHLFEKKITENKRSKLRIAYTGIVTEKYPYTALGKALLVSKQAVEIVFTGSVEPQIISYFEAIPRCSVIDHGKKNHEEAVQAMFDTDINLLLLPNQDNAELMVTGKLFEYIATGKPIICIGNAKAEAISMLQRYAPLYLVLSEENSADFATFIEQVHTNIPRAIELEKHELSKKQLAKKLQTILTQVIQSA